jgi:glucokinase
METDVIIGVDLGGTKVGLCRADGAGVISQTSRFLTTTCAATLDRLEQEIAALNPGPAPVFGIACGGPLDARRGLILSPPNLPGWDAVPITDRLVQRFGGRAFLMNDANAGALAEWRFGAGQFDGRWAEHLVFLTSGTGMGGGLISNGRLVEGANGNAGEVGHLRLSPEGPLGYGKSGSFEGWCSGGGIGRQAQAMVHERGGAVAFNPGPGQEASARDVVAAAGAGDALAQELLATSGHRLGQALALILDLVNPEVVVIGNVYRRAQRFIEPAMRRTLAAEALPETVAACRIVPAALGEEVGNVAAVCVALHHLGRFNVHSGTTP